MPPTNGPAMTPTIAAAFESSRPGPRLPTRGPRGHPRHPAPRPRRRRRPGRRGPRAAQNEPANPRPSVATAIAAPAATTRRAPMRSARWPSGIDVATTAMLNAARSHPDSTLVRPNSEQVVGEERHDRRPHGEVDGDEQRDERDEAAQGASMVSATALGFTARAPGHGVSHVASPTSHPRRAHLRRLGAVKVAFWVLLIALAVAVVAGFLGRGLFVRRSSL
jgi:hypothetical protein